MIEFCQRLDSNGFQSLKVRLTILLTTMTLAFKAENLSLFWHSSPIRLARMIHEICMRMSKSSLGLLRMAAWYGL